jgi:SNF2 family DNA or RNA helicase
LDKDDPDEATKFEYLPNPRMKALKDVLRARIGKKVIWCRFTKDIELGMREFNDAVSYYGGNGRDERSENKQQFINNKHVQNMFSNPAVGGTGVDGLQKVARTAIYYSNSYNSVQRWQSEDRIDRIGMGEGSSTYIDLVARDTVDLPILRNLRKKKQLSDLVLDDIRQLFMAEEEANDEDN